MDKIRVAVPVDATPEVKAVNIAGKFKGLTYEFFNHYSDALRKRLFRSVEGKERPRTNVAGDTEFVIDYD